MEDLRPQQWHVLCAWAASHAYIVEIAVLLQLLQLRVGDMELQRELTGWHQLHIVCGEVCDHDSNAMHHDDDTVLSKVKRPAILYTLNNDYKADFRGPTGEMSVGAVPVAG